MWILFALVAVSAPTVFVWSCIRVGEAIKDGRNA